LEKILLKKNCEKSNFAKITINQIQWENLVHPYYIDSSKNKLNISKQFSNLSEEDITKAENFIKRCELMFEQGIKKPASRLFIDAE